MPSLAHLMPPPSEGERSLSIGRVVGAPVTIRWEAFFTFPLFTIGALIHGGVALAAIVLLVLLLSILAHDVAHAVVVRHYGQHVRSIEVTALGGLCWFDADGLGRRQMRAVHAAGPIANLVIAGIAVGLEALRAAPATSAPTLLNAALTDTAIMNLAFGLFNLVPAFPLDGGWTALSLLEPRIGTRPALIAISAFAVLAALPIYLVGLAMLLMGSPFMLVTSVRSNRRILRDAWVEWRTDARQRGASAARQAAALAECDARLASIVARSTRSSKTPS